AESLAQSQPTFQPLADALAAPRNAVDDLLRDLTTQAIRKHQPTIVLISVPFPGTVYAAFRIAQTIRKIDPTIVTVLGGGYVNTELRELSEPRVFDFFHYITLDDGERPLLALLDHLQGNRPIDGLVRTFVRTGEPPAVRYVTTHEPDVPFAETGTPTWDGLPLDRYLSPLDMLNPMHRLWTDGRWNKLTVAHGCYWKKCSFCDVTLDYISRYDPVAATTLVDRVEAIIQETGQ
ncbi:MAG: radical SAM protein, partial [Phycisphaerae bacterium]